MVNLGALNRFDSFIKKLTKALNYINHVIYTPEVSIMLFVDFDY